MVLVEELIIYYHVDENGNDSTVAQTYASIRGIMKGHVLALYYFCFYKNQITYTPLHMIYSMDEMTRAQVLKLLRKKSRNRKLSIRAEYIVICMYENQ